MARSEKKNIPRGKRKTTREEELLFKRSRLGDEAARDELIKTYSPWVVNIARKYHACFPKIEQTELVAEGNRGLLEAIQRFDSSRSTKFSTYAWFWIVKNIQEYISSSIALIEVPGRVMTDLRKVINSMNDEIKKGKEPSLEEISSKLSLDLDAVTEMLSNKRNLSNPLSLDKYLDEDNRDQTLADIIEDKNTVTVQRIMERLDNEVNISELLGQLSPVEQEIIKWRFGFNDNRAHALNEIGKKLKISPAKVKDIESIALIKLKRILDKSDKYTEERM